MRQILYLTGMVDALASPWVVVPTYNEAKNIERLIRALFGLAGRRLHVLIVDDNSPDGTGQLVRTLQTQWPQLHLEVREQKAGLGRAYVHGFTVAQQQGATAVVQMDADFSHDPNDVPRLLQGLATHDLVLGSRYSQGISVVNWPLRRLLISIAGNVYARLVSGLPFHDVTGGFKAWRAETLRAIDLPSVNADGYGFQIITTFRAWRLQKRIAEVPIIFTERRAGQSKMSKGIMWEALWIVWKLRLFG